MRLGRAGARADRRALYHQAFMRGEVSTTVRFGACARSEACTGKNRFLVEVLEVPQKARPFLMG